MAWSELPYESQYQVMKLLSDLADLEDDQDMKDALVAAKGELDIWSNVPENFVFEDEVTIVINRTEK